MMTELTKNISWRVWRPKRGRYSGRTVYISILTSPKDTRNFNGVESMGIMLATHTKGKLYMHKGQITQYQYQNYTKPIATSENYELLNTLDVKFEKYKPVWEIKRLINDVKKLLLS